MTWTLPGTTVCAERDAAERAGELFDSLFLAGGLTLSQVSSITGLEPYAIQNWVKRGFLSAPKAKRYDREQLFRIIIINMLRGTLSLEQICSLISYVNGDLADDSDDLIDDGVLYLMFLRIAAQARYLGGTKQWDDAIGEALADYREPVPGARTRVAGVLRTMLSAWITNRLRQETENMLRQLK